MNRYFLFFIASWFLIGCIHAQSRKELEHQRDKILKEIDETDSILYQTKNSKAVSLEKLELLDKKIQLRNSVIDNLLYESENTDRKIKGLEKTTSSLSDDITSIKKEYGHMIYLAYLNRQRNSELMFILSASDFNQAYHRILYLKEYSVYRRHQVAVIESIQDELGKKMEVLSDERKEKLRLVSINQNETLKLKSEVNEKKLLVNKLKSKEKRLIRKLKQKNRIADQISREIERIVKMELAKRRAKGGSFKDLSNKYDTKLNTSFIENKGKLPWPLDKGIVTSTFGEHPHPVYKGVIIRNNGIDISTNSGEEARSIFSGEVKAVLYILGSNYSVIIRHGNFLSVYQNLVDVRVKVGDHVKTNQDLGKVFTDRETKTTVLHLELWDELKKLNPEIWLSKR